MRTTLPHSLFSLLLLALLLLPAAATAQDEPHDGSRHPIGHQILLHRADADRDGVVTADEWRTMTEAIGAAFGNLDEDADGEVTVGTRLKRKVGRMPRAKRRFGHGPRGDWQPGDNARLRGSIGLHRAADAAGDGDGVLSRNEWVDYLGNTDADSDGFLSLDEMRAARRALHPERTEPTGPAVDDLVAGFDRMDADGNGLITENERRHRRRFGIRRDESQD